MDGAGYLQITGRIKDIIIRGGENVSPPQVEEVLCEYKDVAEAAVIGMPDKDLGERVCAYIRLAPGGVADADAIRKFMEKKGASKLLIPERFVFVETLPMTQAGKIDKKVLRKDIEQRLGKILINDTIDPQRPPATVPSRGASSMSGRPPRSLLCTAQQTGP